MRWSLRGGSGLREGLYVFIYASTKVSSGSNTYDPRYTSPALKFPNPLIVWGVLKFYPRTQIWILCNHAEVFWNVPAPPTLQGDHWCLKIFFPENIQLSPLLVSLDPSFSQNLIRNLHISIIPSIAKSGFSCFDTFYRPDQLFFHFANGSYISRTCLFMKCGSHV